MVLKGLSHEIFGPVFWAECEPLVVLNLNDAPLILDNYFLSFDAFQAKHSPRFLESWRRIGNFLKFL